ncbi:MAG: hypothetical protein ACI9Z9_000456 [Litorivivens sp.]
MTASWGNARGWIMMLRFGYFNDAEISFDLRSLARDMALVIANDNHYH